MSKRLDGSIGLSVLKHVRMEVDGQNGKVMGTFIPDKVNHADVVKLKDGGTGVFIPVVVWINDEENDRQQIGSIKQSLPTEVYKSIKEVFQYL